MPTCPFMMKGCLFLSMPMILFEQSLLCSRGVDWNCRPQTAEVEMSIGRLADEADLDKGSLKMEKEFHRWASLWTGVKLSILRLNQSFKKLATRSNKTPRIRINYPQQGSKPAQPNVGSLLQSFDLFSKRSKSYPHTPPKEWGFKKLVNVFLDPVFPTLIVKYSALCDLSRRYLCCVASGDFTKNFHSYFFRGKFSQGKIPYAWSGSDHISMLSLV
jgi:hypothetical protein